MIPKHFKFIFFITLILLSGTNLFAQISDLQDTVVVPSDYVNNNGNTTGSLNQFIADDKADGGIPAGRVYLLKRGEYYLLSGRIDVDSSYVLRLVGEEGPADTQPAVVSGGLKEDGSGFWQYLTTTNDVEFRNIYFKGATPTDILTGECLRILGPDVTLVADNCVFDSFHFVTLHFFKVNGGSAYITNCYFRNLNHKNGGKYNGRGLRFMQADADTIVMQNNTFVNSNSFFLDVNRFGQANYALIDHNTIINTVKFVFQWHHQTNAVFTNNLIYNGHSYGETVADAANQDPDGLVFGIFGIDTINTDMTGEADRYVALTNNSWFYDSAVQAYWDGRDSIQSEMFLNTRSQAMFDDDATWPNLIEENNINTDVNFTNFTTQTRDDMIAYMIGDRDGTEKENNWGWYPDDNVYQIYWPISTIEDFSYATNDAIYSAGTGGFPIGDLNWFPDKKAEWEDWISDVNDDEISDVPTNYSLKQNYPNPFNPSTVISFTLPKGSIVSLKVFNVLGEEVTELINEFKNAGVHKVTFNASDLPSGVYIYSLSAGDFIATKKMMLLK